MLGRNPAGVDCLGPGDITGCWVVSTASGSVHLLDFETGQVARLRQSSDASDLRRDGDAIMLLAIGPVKVGMPLVMVLQVRADAVRTLRCSTPVVSIRRLPPGDTPPERDDA